ncbi:MAG: glutathione-disulfide reductase [Alphaproteobacteria bacterium]|nr:glutathione-disulfide reductase [Alphaproteobacteria bacterium]
MPDYDFDLFVIGAGSGGVRAARLAAQTGARVAIAEEYRIGGTCVIRGCVPKKLLVYASEFSQNFKDAKGFGWTVEWARFDWASLRDNVQAEVSRLSAAYRANLDKAGVETIEDRARFAGPNKLYLEKAKRAVTAKRVLIATGGRPTIPGEIKGVEHAITSNEAFHLEDLPKQIVIAGGGYIAVEFATIFSGLGVETTLVHRGEHILRGFDEDVRAFVQNELARTGVRMILNATISQIAPTGAGQLVTLGNGMRIEADQTMLALGRSPNTQALGLEEAGVHVRENGAVIVDAHSKTNVDHIYALGDVTDRMALTPVAIREAVAFVETVYKNNPTAFDHHDVATAVFGRPPIGCVGMTEAEARRQFGHVDVYKTSFRPMKHILAGNDERVLMKLIVHPVSHKVIGVHIVGRDAPEMIQIAAIAVKAGLTKAQWDETCAVHPTAAEELVLLREKSA